MSDEPKSTLTKEQMQAALDAAQKQKTSDPSAAQPAAPAMDPALQRDILRAKAACVARLEAPPLSMSPPNFHPRKAWMKRILTVAGYNTPDWHPMCDEKHRHEQNLAAGYIPVPDSNGQHARDGNDFLYVLPTRLYQDGVTATARRGDFILGDSPAVVQEARASGSGDMASAVEHSGKPFKGTQEQFKAAAKAFEAD